MNAVRKILIIICAAAFLICAGVVAVNLVDYKKSTDIYAEAVSLAKIAEAKSVEETLKPAGTEEPETSEDPETPQPDDQMLALMSTDLESLKKVNSDVQGWIYMPDTVVSYPLMYCEDNWKYLSTAWDGTASNRGSIYINSGNDAGLGDFHTIIYGHRMNGGSMFGSLKNFKEYDYWDSHRNIYIVTEDYCFKYEIFAVRYAGVDGSVFAGDYADDEAKQAFIDECLADSEYETGITPTEEDRILTLSTCTVNHDYSKRWVIQARLVMQCENSGEENG